MGWRARHAMARHALAWYPRAGNADASQLEIPHTLVWLLLPATNAGRWADLVGYSGSDRVRGAHSGARPETPPASCHFFSSGDIANFSLRAGICPGSQ